MSSKRLQFNFTGKKNHESFFLAVEPPLLVDTFFGSFRTGQLTSCVVIDFIADDKIGLQPDLVYLATITIVDPPVDNATFAMVTVEDDDGKILLLTSQKSAQHG